MDKTFQKSLRSAKIKYSEDFYDADMNPDAEPIPPEWKVYFNGNFWGHRGRDRAGMEIVLDKQFEWVGRRWVIPAAYSCGKGLVIDFCMRVEPERIRSFMEKWNLNQENDSSENFTREQRMQMEWENPLCLPFHPHLELNGKTLRTSGGCSTVYNPCVPERAAYESTGTWAVDHYGLDTSYGWVIYRNSFPWASRRKPNIRRLLLTMEQQPGHIPGPHFQPHQPGDSLSFFHPVNGTKYTLTVQELERQTVPAMSFGSDRRIYPTHLVSMSYTLSPEPEEDISICDCCENDRPREIAPRDPLLPVAQGDFAVIGVIGGADGPTSIVFGKNPQGKPKTAYSSLHFEPAEDDVEWYLIFKVKQFEDKSFVLL